MFWLGALLIAVVVLEFIQRQRLFASAMLFAALGFVLSLALLNVDGFIVRQNVARTEAGHELDVAYLASLSEDAVPTLANAFHSSQFSTGTREAVGAVLACRAAQAESRQLESDWQSFHLSRWQAGRIMPVLKTELRGYRVDDSDWPSTVTTPSGEEYTCWTYGYYD